MTIRAMKFDPIQYARQLRDAGVSQEQADIQAQTIELVISDMVNNQDLVTKKDLDTRLAELKLELIKWILGTGVATVMALAALLKLHV
jgi:hypothetical protein